MTTTIHQGDCRHMDAIADGSIHCVATSPPYWGLRSYLAKDDPAKASEIGAEPTPEGYVASMVEVGREVRRVLREDGTWWLNLGDGYAANVGMGHGGRHAQGDKWGGTSADKRGVGLPPKSLLLMPFRVALALQADGWILRAAIPWVKCLSGGARVYARTQKGDMPATLKDLVRLDPSTVKLWNGKRWTQVLAWNESPRKGDELEIELRSGERIASTLEHRWPTQRGLVETAELRPGDTINECRLPEPEAPRRPTLLDDADIGWLAGFYLAEGNHVPGGIAFSTHAGETEYTDRIKRIAESYDCTFKKHDARDGNGSVSVVFGPVMAGIVDSYITGTTAKDKHLSMRCWKRSDAFLRSLAQGYLDGDGGHDAANNRWRLGFCANDALASDLRTLAARIGARVRLRRAVHVNTLTEKKHPGWKGEWRFDPVRGSAMPCTFKPSANGEIVAIRAARARVFWDVTVEDDPHLFALASGVLTHNCNAMPESVQDRPTTAHETVFLLARSERYYFDADAVRVGHDSAYSLDAIAKRGGVGGARPVGNNFSKEARDATGITTPRTRADRAALLNPAGRNIRTSDFHATSLDALSSSLADYQAHLAHVRANGGMLLTPEGEPSAFLVNPVPSPYKHFAMWPPALVKPMILASTSERGCCPACGAGWRRVVEERRKQGNSSPSGGFKAEASQIEREAGGIGRLDGGRRSESGSTFNNNPNKRPPPPATIGWEQGCSCPPAPPIPCTVLDPFAGTSTTLRVADDLGRHAVGYELNAAYLPIGAERTAQQGLFSMSAKESAQ